MKNVSFAFAAAAAVLGCGDRPSNYDAPVSSPVTAIALDNGVALLDSGTNRVVLLTPRAGQELDRAVFPMGKNVARSLSSPDAKRIFVLSAGDVTAKKDREKASLSVIEGGSVRSFALESPHSGLSIDPQGRWVAIFAAPDHPQTAFVENPNEVVLVDLTAPPDRAVTSRTIRSFGGKPQRVSFSPPLLLPGGSRHLLAVETEQDVTLLDLDNVNATPKRPEITVRLTSGGTTAVNAPAGIVFDDGDPAKSDDARIGVRLSGSPNVVTLTLEAQAPDAKAEDPATVPNDFRADVNLTDVGGEPGDVVFVRTDVGIRLAAVVPSKGQAVLVDPATSVTTTVALPDAYARISLITSAVAAGAATDTVLLSGAGTVRSVAFWSLGRATGQPYRSVEVVSLPTPVDTVTAVPPPHPQLKVLSASNASAFYVLDLVTRTASPLTTLSAPNLHVAPDGGRLWAFQRGSSNLAAVSLADLHPTALPLDRPIDAVFDVATLDGGRALVAIDSRGAVGATVLDALFPDTATAHSTYGLLLENLR